VIVISVGEGESERAVVDNFDLNYHVSFRIVAGGKPFMVCGRGR
jgi:hypothetical protein